MVMSKITKKWIARAGLMILLGVPAGIGFYEVVLATWFTGDYSLFSSCHIGWNITDACIKIMSSKDAPGQLVAQGFECILFGFFLVIALIFGFFKSLAWCLKNV